MSKENTNESAPHILNIVLIGGHAVKNHTFMMYTRGIEIESSLAQMAPLRMSFLRDPAQGTSGRAGNVHLGHIFTNSRPVMSTNMVTIASIPVKDATRVNTGVGGCGYYCRPGTLVKKAIGVLSSTQTSF